MDTQTAYIIVLILINILISVYNLLLLRKINRIQIQTMPALSTQVGEMKKRLNDIFVIDKPAPNTMINQDANKIDINDINPNFLPKDIKFQVEGGDVFTPPEFLS